MGDTEEEKVVYLRLDDIIPNRFQPREVFDETGLEELADSIKEHGVIQPIIVRQIGDKYELIAGERRSKASAIAGLTTIPAIIKNMDDKESAKVSLLENLQRKNLSAIEEARTYKRILELDNMTQEDLARTMGRSQPMIANKLRLLSLPEEVQNALIKNQISERHARSLLTVSNKKDQLDFLNRIRTERLTVRELDAEIKKYKENLDSESGDASGEIKEIKREENNMNNNLGNFGGMGLNDYQSGIQNNMFNNIPNNFNNMPNNTQNTNNNSFDYSAFNEEGNMNASTQSVNDNFNYNSSPVSSQPSSLGSMFDGGLGQSTPNYVSNNINNNNSNLFVSHIREDNVPQKENQFLPNFDDFNKNNGNNFLVDSDDSNGSREAFNKFDESNSFNQGFNNSMMNNFESMNNIGNNYSASNNGFNSDMNSFNDAMNRNFVSNNKNMDMGMNSFNQFEPQNNNQYQGNNMNTFGNFNDFNYSLNSTNDNNNMMNNTPNNDYSFKNDLNNNINNYNSMSSNEFSMSNFENYNNFHGNNNGAIPDFNGMSNNYNPKEGNLFNQPLNIVDVPHQMENNYVEQNVNNTYPYNGLENSEISNPNQMSTSEYSNTNQPIQNNMNFNDNDSNINQEKFDNPLDDDYEKILNVNPVPVELNENEGNVDKEITNDNQSLEEHNDLEDTKEIPGVPEIEIIGDNEVTLPMEESSTDKNNNEYITLEPEITMHTTRDAVLELKKTTDRIKQNHIDIETEEIDFDDVYQITIKIKKQEN